MRTSSHILGRLIIAGVSLIAGSWSVALAQYGIANPLADVSDPVGSLWRAMEQRRLIGIAAVADMESERFRVAGQARIDAGKASTTFQRAAGSLAPAQFGAQAPNPADRQAWTEDYAYGLGYFEYLAKTNNCNLNDVADGWGLAFTIAFETYSGGKSATAAQRMSYAAAKRQTLMNDPRFQASTDEERQLLFEKFGMYAALSALKSQLADKNGNKVLQDQAQQFARATLAALWPFPLEGLELTSAGFEDRGVRLIREGKATAQFTPPAAPLVTNPQQLQLWQGFVHYMQFRKIPMNDLVGTLGECVLINWENANLGQKLSQQQYYWTFAGIEKIILTNPDWQRMNDVEKERSLESFAINTMAANAEFQQAARPVVEKLSGGLLQVARSSGFDEASLRLGRMKIASYKSVVNLDSFFRPKFAQYTLNENGFILANAGSRR